ncbi:MAG: SDR family oxidoreductase, partial [Candidatus Eremiobacteraeota bacterium]|nr:SDR family oxidoreductase [Candidatus Eremiobacteraeota bacterium]
VARGIGGEALTIDASRPDDVERLAEEATRRLGRIDVAVTTPGINIRKPLVEYTDEDFDRTYALNVRGTFLFLRAFARRTIAQGGNASLIACSSIRAETLEPGLTVYASTKSAITQLVRGAAAELGRYNIRVNAIAPSIIETALTAPIKARPEIYEKYAAHTVLGRWGTIHEVGAAVAFLASDAASYISGTWFLIDGGWTAIDGPPTGLA